MGCWASALCLETCGLLSHSYEKAIFKRDKCMQCVALFLQSFARHHTSPVNCTFIIMIHHICTCTYMSPPTSRRRVSHGRTFSEREVIWRRSWRDLQPRYIFGKVLFHSRPQRLIPTAQQFPNRPIIFVAHSLGGVLLKKVLMTRIVSSRLSATRLIINRPYYSHTRMFRILDLS